MSQLDVANATDSTTLERVWPGVSTLLDDYVALDARDHVIILYTPDAKAAAAWVVAAMRDRSVSPTLVPTAPLVDAGLAARLTDALPAPRELRTRLVLITMECTTMSHHGTVRSALSAYNEDAWRTFRITNASPEFFTHAMNLRPDELSDLNAGLLNVLIPSRHMLITSTAGTALDVEIDSSTYRWISNRGMWRPGAFVVLPPGEVSTFPSSINGILVADGAFNTTAYTALDARLRDHPVTVEIEEGRAVDFRCDDRWVRELVRRCLAAENADRVGELGFGTNIGCGEFVPMNSHINERRPGVHIGFGQHAQRIEVVPYQCNVHIDLITSDATIVIDGDRTIKSAELELTGAQHPQPHPDGLYEEDIDGECCGLTPHALSSYSGQPLSRCEPQVLPQRQ